jgi:hypothetical protein
METQLESFAEYLQSFYKSEEKRMPEIKGIFNRGIKFSALYKDGILMIPVKNLKNLKLGNLGKGEYVQYQKAFLRFQNRMKEDSYAKQYGEQPLMFVHNN